MVREDYETMLIDGLHPDSKGHEWMANKIIKEIKLKI